MVAFKAKYAVIICQRFGEAPEIDVQADKLWDVIWFLALIIIPCLSC